MTKLEQSNSDQNFSWKSNLRSLAWGLLIAITFMLISLPSMILILFGMVPTLFAWIVDKSEKKYAMFSILGMNFTGLFPFLMDIWFEDHTTKAAIAVLSSLIDLIIIYGAAGFGFIMFIALPPVITTFLMAISERRITALISNQKKIAEEWGQEIIADFELLDLTSNDIDAEV